MRIEEKIAKAVNKKFFANGSKAYLLVKLFDEEMDTAILEGAVTRENAPRVRAEAARIAVKLRLEEIKRRADL